MTHNFAQSLVTRTGKAQRQLQKCSVSDTLPSCKFPLTCQFVSLNPKQDAVVFFRVIDGEKLGFQLIGEEFEQAVFDVSFVFGVAKTHFVPSRRGIRTICSGAQAKDVTH